MTLVTVLDSVKDIYFSEKSTNPEKWDTAFAELETSLDTTREQAFAIELKNNLSDFEMSSEERKDLGKKYGVSMFFYPQKWAPILNTTKESWCDWAFDEFNSWHDLSVDNTQDTRNSVIFNERDTDLLATVLDLNPETIDESALPLLSEALFISDPDLQKKVLDHIQKLGPIAKPLERDLIVAQLFIDDTDTVANTFETMQTSKDEQFALLKSVYANPDEWLFSTGDLLPGRLNTEDSPRFFIQQKVLKAVTKLAIADSSVASVAYDFIASELRNQEQETDIIYTAQESLAKLTLNYTDYFEGAISLLKENLSNDNADLQSNIVRCIASLYSIGKQRVFDELILLANSSDITVKLAAYYWLEKTTHESYPNDNALYQLVSLYKQELVHPLPKMRFLCAHSLKNIGYESTETADVLKDIILNNKETHPEVLLEIILALIAVDPWEDIVYGDRHNITQALDKYIADEGSQEPLFPIRSENCGPLVEALSCDNPNFQIAAAFLLTKAELTTFQKHRIFDVSLANPIQFIENCSRISCPECWKYHDADLSAIAVPGSALHELINNPELNDEDGIFGNGQIGIGASAFIGGVLGRNYGNQYGSGGLGSRGSGLGGGGTPGGLGGLGTRGRGRGASGYGSGGGYFGRKSMGTPGMTTLDPIILGALDKSIVDRVVKQHLAQIRYCYQKELAKNPNLFGKIVVKFVVANDGSVSSATIKDSTMNNSIVEQCICQRFMRFRFPPPKGDGIVIVSYPFVFKDQ
ncbi:MAG: AgmX/PglI C-terminal domain-containing protein [bacterium]